MTTTPRRPGAALPDAEQRVHPELAHLVLVEDLDLDAEFRELFRLLAASVSG